MMLRAGLLVGFVTAGVVLNAALLSRLSLPAVPDLVLLVVVAAAMRRGLETGALLGVAAGYLRDLVGGSPLGLFALSYLIVGASAGAMMTVVDLQQRRMPAMAAALATVLLYAMSGLAVAATGAASVQWTALGIEAGTAVLLNAALARPVDTLVGWAERLTQRRYGARVIGHRGLR